MMTIQSLMATNVYRFCGNILIIGTCLPQVSSGSVETLAENVDGIYSLCLEETHLNMAITKLSAVLGTGLVTKMTFATVDRSPHCTQMHYIRHEIERILPNHVPMESVVVVDNQIIPVSDEAVERSKTLSLL